MSPRSIHQSRRYLDYYDDEPLVGRNPFRAGEPRLSQPPRHSEVRHLLPRPSWSGHEETIRCVERCWELAFANLRAVTPGSGFVSPFVDTAFNHCIFMWDSAFIVLFGRYGARAFDFQGTLDNFYARQHADGFICRELDYTTGADRFHRHDPVSTGPHVLPWAEWEYWRQTDDRRRLARVFWPLCAFHRWLRRERRWPDGCYWSCGLGSGMDNQPRVPGLPDSRLQHGRMSWIDACAQMALAARQLGQMARLLGQSALEAELTQEAAALGQLINARLWNERTQLYGDGLPGGQVSDLCTIGAYWTLLAGVVPAQRVAPLLAALTDPARFGGPHPIPALTADHPAFRADGDYWCGGVWPPTNYMVLRGLERVGQPALAHQLARAHLEQVVRVYEQTGTVWENYAPLGAAPGQPAKPDFVGWSGLGPIAMLLEQVFGLHAEPAHGRLLWDLRLTEAHGVQRYPFGPAGWVELAVEARRSAEQEPVVRAQSTVPLELELRWAGGERRLQLGAG